MTSTLVLALAQLNPTVGDIAGNTRKLLKAHQQATAQGADVVVAAESFLCGYQIDDLVQMGGFFGRIDAALSELAEATSGGGAAIIVGVPRRDDGGLIRNAVFVLDEGGVLGFRDKVHLPNMGVFDDLRHFSAGAMPSPMMVRGVLLGLPICEDIWNPDVLECLDESGAEFFIACNASPFEDGKADDRMMTSVARVVESGKPLVYLNLVGGQDDVVYDGGSFVLNRGGEIAACLPSFTESVALIKGARDSNGWRFQGGLVKPDEGMTAVWRCICLGIRDYVEKNGFERVVLGLSGGIDSALVAVLAVDALGAERVDGVMMPSPYTSQMSLDDAGELAGNLGIALRHVDITESMQAAEAMLGDEGMSDLAKENLQARLRGLALMSISNTTRQMVLTTGNKSEYAAGYATLYGDMCGGYAPLIDVWKTEVFALSRWRNQNLPQGALGKEGDVIPERILNRPPSAELRENQKDSDSLPEYELLDGVMKALVEEQMSVAEINASGIASGHDKELVEHCAKMLMASEYKRRQAPPGPKLTRKAFGRDRRFPITSKYPLGDAP